MQNETRFSIMEIKQYKNTMKYEIKNNSKAFFICMSEQNVHNHNSNEEKGNKTGV